MIKIVTNEDLSELSSWVTPTAQDAPCSNCSEVKDAIKSNNIEALLRICNAGKAESAEIIKACMQCLWYWVDEVEEIDP